MRAILFSKNEQKFDTYGLGEIDALKGNVTRERNGLYSIYLEYPADDQMSSIFEKEMKIKADAGVRTKNQTFEISRIVKDSTGIIKIYGYHISHKLEYMAVTNGTSANGSARDVLAIWSNALVGDYHFDTWSDIDSVGKTTFSVDKFENARQALGGVEGSILDIFGGEYEFDNMTIRLHKRLGRKAPTVLEYGRNILSAESDDSIEASYTSIYPFATYTPDGDSGQKDPVIVTIPEKYVDSKYISMYSNRRIKVVDFSSKFKDKDIPTPEKLKNFASNYMAKNKIGAPKINTKIDYVDLGSTLDYQGRKVVEELELCDIVPIYYPTIGITEDDAKVTKIVYDFINERNESVEFGLIGTSIRSAMTSNVSERLDTLEGRQKALESDLPAFLLNAQGNKIWYDTPDNTKEHKIGDTWFEKNGLYERMYIWNGEMWEKIIDTEDVSRLKSEFDAEVEKITKSLSDQDKKAEEALKASGANSSVLTEVKQTLQQFDTDFVNIRKNVEVNKKSVEDNLKGLTRRFEELNTNRNYILNSGNATISQTLELSSDFIPDVNQARTFTMSVEVEGHDIGPNPANNRKRYGFGAIVTFTDDTMWYPEVWETDDSSRKRIFKTWTIPEGKTVKSIKGVLINDTNKENTVLAKPKLEIGGEMTPWKETAESFAEAKLAEYAQTVDGRFTRLANQYVDKTEFQKVQETSKLYERVLGSTENDLNMKVSRMVLGNQLFQVEVEKINNIGRNLLKGTRHFFGQWFNDNYWTRESERYNELDVMSRNQAWQGISQSINAKEGEAYTFSLFMRSEWEKDAVNFHSISNNKENQGWATPSEQRVEITKSWKRYAFTFIVTKSGLVLPRIERFNGNTKVLMAGLKLEKGSKATPWSPHPDDTDNLLEATRAQMTLLSDSWAVKVLKSNGDIVSQINATGSDVRIQGESIHLNGKTLIDKAVIDGAAIKNMTADKITGGELNFANIKTINFDAKNVTSGIFTGLTFRGGRVVSLNGEVDIDLQRGHFNINTDNAAIRRIKDGYSSQFIKMITGTYIGEYGTNKTSLTIIGSNSDRSEDTEGGGFAGYRLWNAHNPKVAQTFPGKTNESFGELVSDRLVIRSNKKNYSNWLFHNNVPGNETYFMPMNENGMKHVLGRGDKLFESIYVRNIYTGGNYSLNQQVWDLLTCFGQLRRTGWQFTSHVINHISNILNLYGA